VALGASYGGYMISESLPLPHFLRVCACFGMGWIVSVLTKVW